MRRKSKRKKMDKKTQQCFFDSAGSHCSLRFTLHETTEQHVHIQFNKPNRLLVSPDFNKSEQANIILYVTSPGTTQQSHLEYKIQHQGLGKLKNLPTLPKRSLFLKALPFFRRIHWDFFNLSFEGRYKVIKKNERFYTSMVCYLRLFELMHQIIATLQNTSAQLHTSAVLVMLHFN